MKNDMKKNENETWLSDSMSVSTLRDDGTMCCPNCGSETDVDHIRRKDKTGIGGCPYCMPNYPDAEDM